MSSFKHNLHKARGSIVFLIGLTLAFATVVSLERWNPELTKQTTQITKNADKDIPTKRAHRELSEEEFGWAGIAWRYFENNYNEETGLVNSVNGYPASTLWDTSSYLLGMISAFRLGIIEQEEFETRTTLLLKTLAELELFDSQLPNKSYNTITTRMVTYTNEVTERGIGWSAIDIGRLMVPLNILIWKYPQFSSEVGDILAQWDLSVLVKNGEMFGADIDESDETIYLQEGRLGYEEYAAKALSLIGLDVSLALNYEENLELESIYGVKVGTDIRSPEKFGALNYVVSEPYVLDGVEYGWDIKSRVLAERIFKVQNERFDRTGIVTAVSEDNIDQAPYFVYNTVFAAGKSWNAITESGEDASEFRTVSTKAAMGLYALFDTDYSQLLVDSVSKNYDEELGWYSGIYEASGEANKAITANTNGIILETLHYIQNGPLLSLHTNNILVAEEAE